MTGNTAAPVIDLRTQRGYRPDVASQACQRLAAARQQSGLTLAAFAAELEPILNWRPPLDVLKAWEATVPPPGHVLIAAGLIAQQRGPAATDTALAITALYSPPDSSQFPDAASADAAAMAGFRDADLRLGGGHLYEAVSHYLTTQVAPRLLLADGGNDGAAWTSAAAVCDMAGWMAHDAGDNTRARSHFARARDLLKVSGHRQLTAHAFASLGHVADHDGHPEDAAAAAHAGLAALAGGPRCPDLEARLLAIQARALARLHKPHEAAEQLALAEAALATERGEPCSPWISTFDDGALASEAARCLMRLGHIDQAFRQADRVLALRPASRPRSRALGLFVHANVLLRKGELDGACLVGAEILRVTDPVGSQVIADQLRTLQRNLIPHQSNRTVNDLLAQLEPTLHSRRPTHQEPAPATVTPLRIARSPR